MKIYCNRNSNIESKFDQFIGKDIWVNVKTANTYYPEYYWVRVLSNSSNPEQSGCCYIVNKVFASCYPDGGGYYVPEEVPITRYTQEEIDYFLTKRMIINTNYYELVQPIDIMTTEELFVPWIEDEE